MLEITPITFRAACAFVEEMHRHHSKPQGHKFSIALEHDGKLCGVVMVGRPVARALDDGKTAEITRLATDGTKNACSMLYGAACRAAKAMGYKRIFTYTLATEPGVSLVGSGWSQDGVVPGRGWRCNSRPNAADSHPLEDKIRWLKNLQ